MKTVILVGRKILTLMDTVKMVGVLTKVDRRRVGIYFTQYASEDESVSVMYPTSMLFYSYIGTPLYPT